MTITKEMVEEISMQQVVAIVNSKTHYGGKPMHNVTMEEFDLVFDEWKSNYYDFLWGLENLVNTKKEVEFFLEGISDGIPIITDQLNDLNFFELLRILDYCNYNQNLENDEQKAFVEFCYEHVLIPNFLKDCNLIFQLKDDKMSSFRNPFLFESIDEAGINYLIENKIINDNSEFENLCYKELQEIKNFD